MRFAFVALVVGFVLGRVIPRVEPEIVSWTLFEIAKKPEGNDVRELVPGQAFEVWEGEKHSGGKRIAAARCDTPKIFCARLPEWVRKDAVVCKGLKR